MEVVTLPVATGVSLPATVNLHPHQNVAIVTHGLGARDPKERDHQNDPWIALIQTAADAATISTVMYTTRGHGHSTGWEDTAESDQEQFTWSRLSDDMVAVAKHLSINQYFVGGSSMGSATALYTAIRYPEKVLGLIMIRPPTAWEERKLRKKNLLSSANKCRDSNPPEEKYHFVLRGASAADLPPLDQPEQYSRITCPTLILTVEGDTSHPVSTAQALVELIPNAGQCIAITFDERNRF